jgi:hypothetical protein
MKLNIRSTNNNIQNIVDLENKNLRANRKMTSKNKINVTLLVAIIFTQG